MARRFFIFIISAYQVMLSPWLPNSCRFDPTCSEYAKEAFRQYNFWGAFVLSVRRIVKCHPFHPGGHDPLPVKKVTNG